MGRKAGGFAAIAPKALSNSLCAVLCVALCAAVFSSCGKVGGTASKSAVPAGMTLAWSDEFDADGAPDKTKWDYSTGGNGWGNGEAQNYTNTRVNSYVADGVLTLRAVNKGGLWTSARLKTQYKAEWTYGYIEIRARLPKGTGTWPALWMLPTFNKYGAWPRSGEIDIVELAGSEPNVIHTTCHTASRNPGLGNQITRVDTLKGASSGFHTYGVEWNPSYLQWYVDGKPFHRFDNPGTGFAEWPFDNPFYLIMNLAIGGTFGGKNGIDKNMKEAKLVIDYVRVYR